MRGIPRGLLGMCHQVLPPELLPKSLRGLKAVLPGYHYPRAAKDPYLLQSPSPWAKRIGDDGTAAVK